MIGDFSELYASLVARYADAVRTWAYKLTGNDADADDVAQDVWARVGEKLDQLKDTERPGGWLRKIVRTAWEQWTRSNKPSEADGYLHQVDERAWVPSAVLE